MNFIENKMKNALYEIYDAKINQDKIFEIMDEILDYDNYIDLYEYFVPRVIDYVDGNSLLDYIYDIDELENYVMYLFHKEKIDFSKVNFDIYKYLLDYTKWGKNFILKNIDEIANDRITKLIEWAKEDNSLYSLFADNIKDKKILNDFIKYSIHYSLYTFDEKYIDKAIHDDNLDYIQINMFSNENKSKLIKNDLGYMIAFLKSYKNTFEKHGEDLFKSEDSHKITILSCLSDKYNYLKDKYNVALELYNTSFSSYRTDMALSCAINYGKYDELVDYLNEIDKDHTFKLISNNTNTSDVFSFGNNIIKLGSPRYNNNINTNFFRIIPNHFIHVKDDNGNVVAVIEFQKKINTDESKITKQMIYELFIDLRNAGMYVCDPYCLVMDSSNFGILDSYKDATLGEYSCHDELPSHFKKNPLVITDVDLIYEYNSDIKPPSSLPLKTTMDDVIKNYEYAVKYLKK